MEEPMKNVSNEIWSNVWDKVRTQFMHYKAAHLNVQDKVRINLLNNVWNDVETNVRSNVQENIRSITNP